MNRYNRLIGAVALTENKFLFYSNYTYTILDITVNLPEGNHEALIIQDHPGKQVDLGSTWFDHLKKSQAKYLNIEAHMLKEQDTASNSATEESST